MSPRSVIAALVLATAPCGGPAFAQQTDLDLDTAIQQTLQNNPEINAARQRIEKQEGVITELRGHIVPNLALTVAFQQIDPDLVPERDGETFGSDQNWNARLTLTQILYAGGQVWSTGRIERTRLLSAGAELESVINRVLFQVQSRYFAALAAQAEIQVHQDTLQLLEQELAAVQQRRDAGGASRLEVLRAQVELANQKAPLVAARNNARIARLQLLQTIGPGTRADSLAQPSTESVGLGDPALDDLDQAVASALANRPELLAARSRLDIADESIDRTRSGYLPRLNLSADYGAEKVRFADSFWATQHGWTLGLNGSWTLFDGLSSKGLKHQAVAEQTIAQLDLQALEFSIELDVRRAFAALEEQQELLRATATAVEQATESRRLTNLAFQSGGVSQLDVFAARVALAQARLNHVRTKYGVLTATADLRRAAAMYTRGD